MAFFLKETKTAWSEGEMHKEKGRIVKFSAPFFENPPEENKSRIERPLLFSSLRVFNFSTQERSY